MDSSGESERLGTPGRARFGGALQYRARPDAGSSGGCRRARFRGLDMPGKVPVRAIIVQYWLYVVLRCSGFEWM